LENFSGTVVDTLPNNFTYTPDDSTVDACDYSNEPPPFAATNDTDDSSNEGSNSSDGVRDNGGFRPVPFDSDEGKVESHDNIPARLAPQFSLKYDYDVDSDDDSIPPPILSRYWLLDGVDSDSDSDGPAPELPSFEQPYPDRIRGGGVGRRAIPDGDSSSSSSDGKPVARPRPIPPVANRPRRAIRDSDSSSSSSSSDGKPVARRPQPIPVVANPRRALPLSSIKMAKPDLLDTSGLTSTDEDSSIDSNRSRNVQVPERVISIQALLDQPTDSEAETLQPDDAPIDSEPEPELHDAPIEPEHNDSESESDDDEIEVLGVKKADRKKKKKVWSSDSSLAGEEGSSGSTSSDDCVVVENPDLGTRVKEATIEDPNPYLGTRLKAAPDVVEVFSHHSRPSLPRTTGEPAFQLKAAPPGSTARSATANNPAFQLKAAPPGSTARSAVSAKPAFQLKAAPPGSTARSAKSLPGSACGSGLPDSSSWAAIPGSATTANSDLELPQVNALEIMWPSFRREITNMTDDQLKKQNWVPPELQAQIDLFRPRSDHISQDNNARDRTVLARYLRQLFPTGRLFASYYQLWEAVKKVGAAWGFGVTNKSKKISCTLGNHDATRKIKGETLKDQVGCNFFIGYSVQGFTSKKRMEGASQLHFPCKITQAEYHHNCQCSTISHRQSITVGHKTIPKYEVLKHVVDIVRTNPTITNSELKKHLVGYVPSYLSLGPVRMQAFRRCLNVHAFNRERDLGKDELDGLGAALDGTSEQVPAHLEFSELADNPMTRVGFRDMLRKIMQESGDIWEVISLLDDAKAKLPGFVYKIRRDERGHPIGILWMTAQMRRNAVLYGMIICLDAQKRQMNNLAWPYMGPTVKDGEFRPRVAAESLHIQEDLDTYAWTLKTMQELEPQFVLHEIAIFFGDEAVTSGLTRRLGIPALTCGDYYHLMKEVWPKHFGPTIWVSVKPHLEKMFCSRFKAEFDQSFEKAKTLTGIRDNPHHLEYLRDIHGNPDRYGGYKRRAVPGNMDLMGSTAAEQNHSSITAKLGRGGIMSLAEMIAGLLERQKDFAKADTENTWNFMEKRRSFQSKYEEDDCKKIDEAAHFCLTQWAYSKFKDTMKRYRRSAATFPAHAPHVAFVHPDYLDASEFTLEMAKRNVRVQVLGRDGSCDCPMKVSFGMQCFHNLVVKNHFDARSFAKRWFNSHFLREKQLDFDWKKSDSFARLSNGSANTTPASTTHVHHSPGRMIENPLSPSMGGGTLANIGSPTSPPQRRLPSGRLNYQHCMTLCTELCRTAQNDRLAMETLAMVVDEMTGHFREGRKFLSLSVAFTESTTNRSLSLALTETGANRLALNGEPAPARNGGAVSATSRPITNTTSLKRKQSVVERSRSQPRSQSAKRRRTAFTGKSNRASDQYHVGTKHNNTSKSCGLCKLTGHQIRSCPKITIYAVAPLPMQRQQHTLNQHHRDLLRNSLNVKNHYLTVIRGPGELEKPVLGNVPPNNTKGIVLHDRMIMDSDGTLAYSDRPGNYCFLCTVLGERGDPRPDYTRVLFNHNALTRYLSKAGTTSIIINAMEVSTVMPFENIHEQGGAMGPDDGQGSSPPFAGSQIVAWR